MDGTKQVTLKDARIIRDYIRNNGGKIDRDGCIIGSIPVYSDVLERWLNKYNAFFWIHSTGNLQISNWPDEELDPPKRFQIKVCKGNLTEGGIESALEDHYRCSVSVREVKNDC